MKALYFLTTCIVMLWSSIYAQPGSPDLSLDGDGSVTKVIVEEQHAWGNHIINYPNDRYVVTGSSNTSSFGVGVLYRFHEDGSVDSSFNGTGSIILQYPDQDVSGTLSYVMEDGRILTLTNVWNDDTGGATLLWMFNEDGTPDHDFGDYGVKFLDLGYYWEGFYTLAIQPDGKILLAGYGAPLSSEYYEFIVARFHPDGSPDESFDDDGITKKIIGESWSSVSSLLLLPGGKFYVAGYAVFDSIEQFTLVRYNNNGTIDKTFNGDGIAHHGIANASAFADKAILQPDGKIVLCGSASYSSSDNVMAAMRFTANGELDPTFHGDGIGLYPHTSKCGAWSAVIQPDGKLNLAGYSHPTNDGSDMCMLRILPNGLPDFSFGKEGFVDFAVNPENSETITHIDLTPEGRIIVSAFVRFDYWHQLAFARFHSGLLVESDEPENMISKLDLYPNPTSGPVTVEYTLVQNENITIDLVDHMGRKVKSLLTSTSKAAGLHKDDFMLDGEITPGLY